MKECKMKEQFYLAHVVLYAKRWYKWNEDIYSDLSRILELDGYIGYKPYAREGIARIIKQAYDKWSEFLDTCPDYHMNHGEDYFMNEAFRMYRYSITNPKYNFNDFCDIIIMTALCAFSNADNEYLNIPCPVYDENNLPNDHGLFGNFSDWYDEAAKKGIKDNKKLAAFFNEKVKEKWREFE